MVAVRRSGVGEELPYVLVPRNKRSKKMKGGGVSRNKEGRSPTSSLNPFRPSITSSSIITYDPTIITIIEIIVKMDIFRI